MKRFLRNFRVDALSVGVGLLAIPFFALLIASLLLLCRGSINPFVFPAAIALAVGLIFRLTRGDKHLFGCTVALLLAIVLGAVLISLFFYDYSYDGIAYHQPAIWYLAHSWNPIVGHVEGTGSLWINHYAKGLETIAATIYSTVGDIEAGKAVNFMVSLAPLFFVYDLLCCCFAHLSAGKKYLLTALIGVSPLVVGQMLTFYIDYSGYSLIAILLVSFVGLCAGRHRRLLLGAAAMCIFMLVAIKFNLFFWAGFFTAFFLLYLLLKKRWPLFCQMLGTAAVSAILGVLTAGFNPYITNTIDHHNPLYPLVGADKHDIVSHITPMYFKDRGRIASVAMGLFSVPTSKVDDPVYRPALPSNITLYNVRRAGGYGAYVGGYGLFFAWLLVVACALYAVSLKKMWRVRRREAQVSIGLLLLLAASLIVLPTGWNARYVPFFYLFPLVMLLFSEYVSRPPRWFAWLKNIAYTLAIGNVALTLALVPIFSVLQKMEVDHYVKVFASSPTPLSINTGISFKAKLDKAHATYKEVPKALLNTEIMWPPEYVDSAQMAGHYFKLPLGLDKLQIYKNRYK